MSPRPMYLSKGAADGPRWLRYKARSALIWGRRPCWYCKHPLDPRFPADPRFAEFCHLISPILAPERRWDPTNLVFGHGKGKCRCSECHLPCNYIAAIAPDMLKNSDGEDLPFSDALMARHAEKERLFMAKSPAIRRNPAATKPEPEQSPPQRWPDSGRDW